MKYWVGQMTGYVPNCVNTLRYAHTVNNIRCYTSKGRNIGIKGSKKKAADPNLPPAIFRGGIFSKVREGNNIFSAMRRLSYGLLFLGGFMSRWAITQLLEAVGRF